ncbi:MAG: helix-turn-helix domain-containing protein [Proteobacteria bacterium]|nr:helix-turn-helix domain-containing protein [Pseudomonadota bacterium]
MRNQNKMRQTGCPVAFGLDTFGDRWSFLVLREMMLKGKKTYGEFLGMNEEIATNVLADRLRHLENEGIITKSRDPENRRSNIYALTDKGRDLASVFVEIILWSGKYDRRTIALKEAVDKIKKDRKRFEASIRAS